MDEDLSDDQVARLLKNAEQRMKSSALRLSALRDCEVTAPSLSGFPTRISTGARDALPVPYVTSTTSGAQITCQAFLSDSKKDLANGARHVTHPQAVNGKAAKEAKSNLSRTAVTPELKRDLQILRARSVLNPKKHYKRDSRQKNDVPEFFQVGTVIEGPTDFFSARLTKQERRRNLVEEVLTVEKSNQRFKSEYNKIQKAKTSGKKGHYRAIKARRAHKRSNR